MNGEHVLDKFRLNPRPLEIFSLEITGFHGHLCLFISLLIPRRAGMPGAPMQTGGSFRWNGCIRGSAFASDTFATPTISRKPAEEVGLTRTSIVNIEQGRQKVMIHTLYQLADVFGVPVTSLLPAFDETSPLTQVETGALQQDELALFKQTVGQRLQRRETP